MREVELDRFVDATVAEVEGALTPTALVTYEGSFSVLDVEERETGAVVSAGARGLSIALRFEPTDGGIRYEQLGEAGPFDEMWTEFSWRAENQGTRVTARSGVSLGLPLAAVTDRVAAWKRRGELERALENLATDLR